MSIPDNAEFLQNFGLEPYERNEDSSFCRYKKKSDDGLIELEFSFDAIESSFQARLMVQNKEIFVVSSERLMEISIIADSKGKHVRTIFDIDGADAEAILTLEPRLHCNWWLLRR